MSLAHDGAGPGYDLRTFGPRRPPPAADLGRLHAELLPTSPLVALGARFVEGFYYEVLPRQGCLFGAVAYVDGEPAGFVTATHDSDGFLRAGARQRPLRLAGALLASMLTERGFARGVSETLAISAGRRGRSAPPAGEMLSFAVRPRYRQMRFVRETGIHVGHDLLSHVTEGLRARGVCCAKAVVDADNLAVQLLLSGEGWRLERDHVPGWRAPSLEFVWSA